MHSVDRQQSADQQGMPSSRQQTADGAPHCTSSPALPRKPPSHSAPDTMARTKQTVHKTTGGEASIRQSATRDEATQGLPETEPPRKRIARGFCTLCKGSSYPQQVVGFTRHPGVAAIANAVPSVAGGAEGGTVPSAVGGAEGGAIASAAMGAIDLTQQQQQEEEEEKVSDARNVKILTELLAIEKCRSGDLEARVRSAQAGWKEAAAATTNWRRKALTSGVDLSRAQATCQQQQARVRELESDLVSARAEGTDALDVRVQEALALDICAAATNAAVAGSFLLTHSQLTPDGVTFIQCPGCLRPPEELRDEGTNVVHIACDCFGGHGSLMCLPCAVGHIRGQSVRIVTNVQGTQTVVGSEWSVPPRCPVCYADWQINSYIVAGVPNGDVPEGQCVYIRPRQPVTLQ
jgi:hypothetical protein